MRSTFFVLVGALLLAVPAALASPGTVEVTAALPLELNGQRGAAVEDGAFLLAGDRGVVALDLEGEAGRLVRVVHRAYGYVNPSDPGFEVMYAERTDRIPLDLAGGQVSLATRRAEFQLLLHEADARLGNGAADGPLHVGALAEPRDVATLPLRDLSLRVGPEAPFLHTLAAGLHQAAATSGRVEAAGPLRLFLSDAVVGYRGPDGDQQVAAHFRTEEQAGSLYDPLRRTWTGPGTHTEYVEEYVVVELEAGTLSLGFTGLPGVLYGDALRLDVDGTAFLPDAVGTVTVQDGEAAVVHALDGQDLELAGRFALTAAGTDADRTRTTLRGEGDLTQVQYGAVSHDYPWDTGVVVAATGLAALLVAGAAWLVSHGKLVPLGGGLVAGYARFQGTAVLEHDGRAQVYEMVKLRPGVTMQELSEDVDFGASALNHHLRVLERNGFVSRLRDGRYVRFFDRQSGRFSGERKNAVSALRNPTTAAIAKAIAAQPGLAQCDLAERFSIAASTVNWHIRRLAAAELVEARRDHHYTRYYLGTAWAVLPGEEQARHLAVAS